MVNFWWVNQRSTYEEERALGLLWAPRLSRAGSRQSHWESMDRVVAGDVVFHYAKGLLLGVSTVVLTSRASARPYSSELWDEMGREVRVDQQELDVPVPLDSVPLTSRRAQTQKNSPFSGVGRVNVGYLFDLTHEFGVELLELVGLTVSATDDQLSDEPKNPDGSPRQFAFAQGETDGTIVVRYRKEQSKLRAFLFGDSATGECDICGRTLPLRLLVTAHIKPRAKCTEKERLDENVVFAACSLGCDALFENGYLQVGADGVLQAGRLTPNSADLTSTLASLVGRRVGRFSRLNAGYFVWHRKYGSL